MLINDGVFDLAVGVGDTGAVRARGKATITGEGLEFTFSGARLPAVDEGSAPVENSVATEIILTRVES